MPKEPLSFTGFDLPTTTPVPDQVFDELMPYLSGAELKVLLYICRRTFGFRKTTDDISLRQICSGIITRDGRVLDSGTGLSIGSVISALKALEEANVIVANRNMSPERGFETTTFALNFRGGREPYFKNRSRATAKTDVGATPVSGDALLREPEIQQTVEQQTVEQETDNSNIRTTSPSRSTPEYDEARRRIVDYIQDISRELQDRASLKSSASRAANLYRDSGLDLDQFVQKMLQARAVTKERTASIRSQEAGSPNKPKMAYFFACLENLIEPRQAELPTN